MPVDDSYRHDERLAVFAVGLFRNLTRKSGYETAILENLSSEGFLAEISSQPNLEDAVELRADGLELTLLGEVSHFRPRGKRWLADVKISHQLDDQTVNRAIARFLEDL